MTGSVFRRRDGVFVYSYQDSSGKWRQKRLPKTITTQRDAEMAARAWLARATASGEIIPAATRDSALTLAQCAPRWIELRRARGTLKAKTVADNESHLRRHIVPDLGALPIDVLTPQRLREWVRVLRARLGSASACRNVVHTLASFLDDAIAERWTRLVDNPARTTAVSVELPRMRLAAPDWMPQAAFARLISDPELDHERAVRYLLAAYAGLRDGEICALTIGDVDGDLLRVDKAIGFRSPEGYAGRDTPKSESSVRMVPLHPTLAEVLETWMRDHLPIVSDAGLGSASLLFPSPKTGRAWRPRSAQWLREDLVRAGLATIGQSGHPVEFHGLRHSFATWLAEAEVPEQTIGRLLGHAGKSVTRRHYIGRELQTLRTAIAALPMQNVVCAARCACAQSKSSKY